MEIPFHEIVHQRILCELSLVDILRQIHRDTGEPFTKEELLQDLETLVKAEREGIRQLGRRKAGQVYGYFEGRRSSVATVDYILETDLVAHYRGIL